MRRIIPLLLAAPAFLSGCGRVAEGGEPVASPRVIIIAVDLSGSQSEGRRAEARRALDLAVDQLGWGDRIVLLQVHQRSAAEDDAVRWSETVPVPRDPRRPTSLDRERLDAVKQAARSVANTVFANDDAGRIPTTDLFATLHVVGEFVRDAGARATTLVMLSDMLQSAHGIEMSRDVPPAEWVRREASRGLVPRLDGACIAVVGADATSRNGIAVRSFWKEYFAAAGATLDERNWRLIATDPAALRCT